MNQRIWVGSALVSLGLSALGCSSAHGSADNDTTAEYAVTTPDAAAPPFQGGPPPEAFAACKSMSEGATCTVMLEEHSIEGVCHGGPNGEPELACVPSFPPGPPGGPPKEALAACEGLAAGAECKVELEARSIAGQCRKGPEDKGALACAPNDRPPPPAHHPPPKEIFEACQSLTDGASCTISFQARTIAGECRKGPGGQAQLACAPKDMPPPPPPPPTETE